MLPPAELLELFFAVLKDFFNALLVSAGLFLTVFTSERSVCVFCESFRMELVGYLPDYEKHERHTEQSPGIYVRNEYEGGKHHRVIPVVYTAVCTALVLEEQITQRAEEEDADYVAYSVGKSDKHEYTCVKHARPIENTERKVERKPRESKC